MKTLFSNIDWTLPAPTAKNAYLFILQFIYDDYVALNVCIIPFALIFQRYFFRVFIILFWMVIYHTQFRDVGSESVQSNKIASHFMDNLRFGVR